jgi:FMN phosphatase YigB (HAD superfamily)
VRSYNISEGYCESARIVDALQMKEPIETLLFDFGGTLDSNGVAWKERFHAFYYAEGLNIADDAFERSFFAADDALVGRLVPSTDLAGTVHALVANLEAEFARRGVAVDKSSVSNKRNNGHRGMRVASRFLSEASAAFARNRPVLESLRERYRLGIVSNFYGNLEAVCHGAGLASLVTALVDSYCVGAEKPDPAIFHAALKTLRAMPETTVFVGDSLRRDGEGARRVGMRFIWMVPHGVHATEARAAADQPVEHAVTQLSELMTILR